MKELIKTDKAPAAIGPYSQGIKSGNMIFLSGQLGIDPAIGKVVEGGVVKQAEQVFKNIKAVLNEAGADLDNIIKATVFLKDMSDFAAVNEVYKANFSEPYPARSAVAVKTLPLDLDVEIEVIASL